MTTAQPDFYISSEEHQFMLDGRPCFILGRVKGMRREGLVWIRVSPPLFEEDIGESQVLITPRLKDLGFEHISTRDVPVYILKILNKQAVLSGEVSESDVMLQWWGEIAKERNLLPHLRY